MEENKNNQVANVANEGAIFEEGAQEGKAKDFLTVYKKRSTFKGATDEDFWYSGTRSDGNSVICKFKCPVETESMAFNISNIIGTMKKKEVTVKGETYINYTYYINSCDFSEIEGEPLPF